MITGSLVAIITPMHEDGRLDLARFRDLIDWHVAEGTDGIVVVGTTGESPTVNFDEHKELIRIAVQHSRGRIPIVAGTGGNSTAEAVELTESAKEAGATACLSVVPYYNKPTQEGLYRHFRKIAEAVDLPMILYNVPGRTVADLQTDTVLRLAQVPGIIGIKEAYREHRAQHRSHPPRAAQLRHLLRRRRHLPRAHPDGRPRRDLGNRERRAQAHASDVRRCCWSAT